MLHVLPVDDSDSHEGNTTCACDPFVEINSEGEILVGHNAFDGRQEYEDATGQGLPGKDWIVARGDEYEMKVVS